MKKFTALHRMLHWLLAFCMPILLATGFLKKFWMGRRTLAGALKSQNIDLADDITKKVAHTISDPMFEWHIYAGFAVAVLLVIRIAYMFTNGIRFPNPFAKNSSVKNKIQGYTYLLFYLFLLVEAITGFIMKFDLLENDKPYHEVHEWGLYWVPVFVILHFIGIYMEESDGEKGVSSKMIGGDF